MIVVMKSGVVRSVDWICVYDRGQFSFRLIYSLDVTLH